MTDTVSTENSLNLPCYYKTIASLSDKNYCDALLKAIDDRMLASPGNDTLMLEKSEIFRRLGLLEQSAEALTKVDDESDKTIRVRRLINSLQPGVSLGGAGEANNEFMPAPFLRYQRCFDNDILARLLRYASDRQICFKQAGIGQKKAVDLNKRKTLSLEDLGEFTNIFRQRVMEDLPGVAQRFDVDPFTPSKIELKITNHMDGDFFNIHKDDGCPGVDSDERIISFVYYFYASPKAFSGGDLLLFDTNKVTSSYKNYLFTRILCENNTLVYFPSEYFHCVDVVNLSSNDFAKGRFAVTGHIRRSVNKEQG